ncbi:MAG: serine/threonine-protein kinase [Bryobacteraceae bacterium]
MNCTALDYAHSRGVYHRDVKPANVFLSSDGAVKLGDFGIARMESASRLMRTGSVLGTPRYMSPEQLHGQPVSGRSDQFSFAVMAYELLVGRLPFDGPSLITQLLLEDLPPVSGISPTADPKLTEVLKRGLAKKPEDRFTTCSELFDHIEAAFQAQSAPAAAAVLPSPSRSRRWAAGVGAVLVASAALLFGLRSFTEPPVPPEPVEAAAPAIEDEPEPDTDPALAPRATP